MVIENMLLGDVDRKNPLYEVSGHPVLDFKVLDGGNAITFSYIIQMDERPTEKNIKTSELTEKSGIWEVLKQKKWIDDDHNILTPLGQSLTADPYEPGTWRVNFVYSKVDLS